MGIGHYTPKSKIEIIKIDALDAQQSNQSDKHGFLLVIDTDRLCDANVVPKTEQIYQKKGENVSCEFVSRGMVSWLFSKVIKISLQTDRLHVPDLHVSWLLIHLMPL